jgi:hypothetical protein
MQSSQISAPPCTETWRFTSCSRRGKNGPFVPRLVLGGASPVSPGAEKAERQPEPAERAERTCTRGGKDMHPGAEGHALEPDLSATVYRDVAVHVVFAKRKEWSVCAPPRPGRSESSRPGGGKGRKAAGTGGKEPKVQVQVPEPAERIDAGRKGQAPEQEKNHALSGSARITRVELSARGSTTGNDRT